MAERKTLSRGLFPGRVSQTVNLLLKVFNGRSDPVESRIHTRPRVTPVTKEPTTKATARTHSARVVSAVIHALTSSHSPVLAGIVAGTIAQAQSSSISAHHALIPSLAHSTTTGSTVVKL